MDARPAEVVPAAALSGTHARLETKVDATVWPAE
jgi:hypothetical protein